MHTDPGYTLDQNFRDLGMPGTRVHSGPGNTRGPGIRAGCISGRGYFDARVYPRSGLTLLALEFA